MKQEEVFRIQQKYIHSMNNKSNFVINNRTKPAQRK